MKRFLRINLAILLVFTLAIPTFASKSQGPNILVNGEKLLVEGVYRESSEKNNRVLVPLRPIFEALKAQVDYDHTSKLITSKKGDQTISLKVNDKQARKNGEIIELDVPAIILGGQTLVPVRFIAQSLGAKVDWFNEGKIIRIDLKEEKSQVENITDLGLDLAYKNFEGKNILLSPLSISSSLGMVANGAWGQTLEEMENVFQTDIKNLNEYLKTYKNTLPSSDKYKVSLANSIWYKDKKSLILDEDFLKTSKDYYGADTYKSKFDEQTKDAINKWVKDKTDGMIESLLDEAPSEDTIMYLINALSFDAEWNKIYHESEIHQGDFFLEGGEKQKADFMFSEENTYLENQNFTGFIKPYKDEKYAFVGLLPKDNKPMEDILKDLSGKEIKDLLANKKTTKVNVELPKFSVTYDLELNKSLIELGMEDAFDKNKADFSKLAKADNGNIFINRVIHKTKIDLDERGTKAGAVTAVEMDLESMPEKIEEVILNRPFFYMIIDKDQELPLFLGALMDLK